MKLSLWFKTIPIRVYMKFPHRGRHKTGHFNTFKQRVVTIESVAQTGLVWLTSLRDESNI